MESQANMTEVVVSRQSTDAPTQDQPLMENHSTPGVWSLARSWKTVAQIALLAVVIFGAGIGIGVAVGKSSSSDSDRTAIDNHVTTKDALNSSSTGSSALSSSGAGPVPFTAGWDFGCHTFNHVHMPKVNITELPLQFSKVDDAFRQHGMASPKHTAYPYGEYNDQVLSVVRQYRKSGRTTTHKDNTYPIANWHELGGWPVQVNISMDSYKELLTRTIAQKTLLVLFSHRIMDSGLTETDIDTQTFIDVVKYVVDLQKAGQLQIKTYSEAYDLWSTATSQPAPTVVFTFDDGWYSTYSVAYPLFKSLGIKGTSWIIPCCMFPDHSSRQQNNHDYISWSQVFNMTSGM